MPKIYTKTGDGGETSLLSGGRVTKDHPRVEAYGTIDELNSQLGLLLCEPLPEGLVERLTGIQETLFDIGSVLADPDGRRTQAHQRWSSEELESWIDEMEGELEPLRDFILPGGSRAAAIAHVARTVCRRAERRVGAAMSPGSPDGILSYVNRLSDCLFVMARWLNARLGIADTRWSGGGSESSK